MKKQLLLVSALLFGALLSLQAQAPQAIQYQTIIRNAAGEVVMNQNVGLQLTVRQTTAIGTAVYQETHTKMTNDYGLVNLQIGAGTTSDDMSAIDWSQGPYYLEVGLDLTGGSSYTVMGTTQLLSVPYALYAEKAGSGTHYVGEVFDGGIVFFVDETGEHGLMASLEDLNDGIRVQWSNVTSTAVGASAQDFFNGASNTTAIIAQTGHASSAAQLCASYSGGGKTDWYLPSHQELYLLGNNSVIINKVLANDSDPNTKGLNVSNDASNSSYWSSTELSRRTAWSLLLQDGLMYGNVKNNTFSVRGVRAF